MISNTQNSQLVAAEEPLICRHCRLGILRGTEVQSEGELFCCAGCRTVYRALHGAGFDKYYQLQSQDSSYSPTPVPRVGASYNYLDDQNFQDKHLLLLADGKRFNAYCEGIHCTACIWVLEKLPQIESGIKKVNVDFSRKVIDVVFDPSIIPLSRLATVLDQFGYAPSILDPKQIVASDKGISRDLLLRLGVAAVSAGNIMMLSVSLYEGGFSVSERSIETVFGWGSFFLAIPAVFFSAQPIIRSAFKALRSGIFHLDLPLAIGILLGFFLSTLNLILGSGIIYFDSVAVLIFLLLCGRVLQERSLIKIQFSSGIAQSLIPNSAHKDLGNGFLSQVYVGSLHKGDVILVKDGEIIPVDGILNGKSGYVNLSVLTGEAVPVEVQNGDPVWAGTKVIGSELRVAVESVGSATRIGTLLQQVEERISREPLNGLTMERLTRKFLLGLSIASVLTIILFAHTGLDSVLNRLLALFVVTCPCALGLAAPLTFTMAIFKAARKGIIIKGGEIVERITKIKKVFLDKTGTITDGEMSVATVFYREDKSSWKLLDKSQKNINSDIKNIFGVAVSLEQDSRHPVGRAIKLFCSSYSEVTSFELANKSNLLKGIKGKDQSGIFWEIRAVERSDLEKITLPIADNDGLTRVGIFKGSDLVMVFGVGDSLRAESRDVIKYFKTRGVEPSLLTGDNEIAANHYGNSCGITEQNIYANCSPEMKAEIIRSSRAQFPTAMVGDGINDTAALTEASVGIGVQGGAEACLKVADVFFTQPGVVGLMDLWKGSYRTMDVLRRCIVFSLIYNFSTGLMAICGIIGPLEAAVLMPFSSITVILLSTKGRSF